MFHGTKDTIHLSSAESNTRFYIDNRQVGEGTSAVVDVPKRGNEHLVLYGRKDGCQDAMSDYQVVLDGLTMLGFFVDFGIVSIWLIDGAATGAWTRAKYDQYTLTPTHCR